MRLTKRLFALSTIALVAAAVAVPATASAETASCELSGVTGSLTPAIPSIIGPGGVQMGGTGTYTFQSSNNPNTTVCSVNNGAPELSSIVSAGRYENDLCSTGRAFGENPAATTVTAPSRTVSGVTYRIDFAGGNGRLDVISIEGRPEAGTPDIDGLINIKPQPGQGNCVNQNVSQFNVTGAFTVSW